MTRADALVLGFDTSGPYCAAALIRGAAVLAHRTEPMKRGQAERLMPMLEEMLSGAHLHWRDLTAIGVGTGPGNFTGIRIAVAAARGLALARAIPAIGVDGFATRAHLLAGGPKTEAAQITIPAPRDMCYLRGADGTIFQRESPPGGGGAAEPTPEAIALAIAQIAAQLCSAPQPAPSPLYARPADAAPARDAPPVMLD